MSDFSGLEQSFALPGVSSLAVLEDLEPPVSTDVQPHEVSFRRLKGPQEIARILHLREEIRLSASTLADAGFRTREKKETN